MDLSWVDVAEPAVAGLAAFLGVQITQDVLVLLRRKGRCPERWKSGRASLVPRGEETGS
jgi:hypothetical protein